MTEYKYEYFTEKEPIYLYNGKVVTEYYNSDPYCNTFNEHELYDLKGNRIGIICSCEMPELQEIGTILTPKYIEYIKEWKRNGIFTKKEMKKGDL